MAFFFFKAKRMKHVWFSLSEPDVVCFAVVVLNMELPTYQAASSCVKHPFACFGNDTISDAQNDFPAHLSGI